MRNSEPSGYICHIKLALYDKLPLVAQLLLTMGNDTSYVKVNCNVTKVDGFDAQMSPGSIFLSKQKSEGINWD